jgi:hypothetical protein
MIYATPEVTITSQSPTFDDQGKDLTSPSLLDKVVSFFLSPTLLLVLLYIIPATSDTSKVVNKSDDQLWDEMMSSERGECSPIPGLFKDDDTHVLQKQKPDTTSLDIPFFPQSIDLVAGSRRQPNTAAKYLF